MNSNIELLHGKSKGGKYVSTTVGRYLGTFAGTYGTYFVRIVSLFKMAHHYDVGVSIMEFLYFIHLGDCSPKFRTMFRSGVLVGNLLFLYLLSVNSWTSLPLSIKKVSPRSHRLVFSAATSSNEGKRLRHKLRLPSSGKDAHLLSRTVPITSDWSITVWEWENPAQVIDSYWEAQRQNAMLVRDSRLLDPFGLVSWPGSVVAAQELCLHQKAAVNDQRVLVLGAGVGIEAQAAAILGAKEVLATDIHPTTLQQLAFGASQEPKIKSGVIQTQIFDLFGTDPIMGNSFDLLIVADVLYNEQLASQVCCRIAEAVAQNPKIRVLVTDSQRFVPTFATELQARLGDQVKDPVEWKEQKLEGFTGSGVCIDEDQTYDVTVRRLWIGLDV